MRITFIGDVHGHFKPLQKIIDGRPGAIVQVGDMGLGFPGYQILFLESRVRFIRGNHDNPEACRKHPNYLGDYGYDPTLNLFFVSGAWSIDQNLRLQGRDWWPDEELSMAQCSEVLTLWDKIKPDYVVTHEGPQEATYRILTKLLLPGSGQSIRLTRTGQLLDQMLAYHRPKLWLFGHWHVAFDEEINGTRFVCLPELAPLTLELP